MDNSRGDILFRYRAHSDHLLDFSGLVVQEDIAVSERCPHDRGYRLLEAVFALQ